MDRKRLVQTLVGVHGFYDRELTEFAIRVWSSALEGYDADTIDAAFDAHLRDTDAGRFMPKPADILRKLKGDLGDTALVEWGAVLECARDGGGRRFSGATGQALDSIGGMYALRMASQDQVPFLQRQFVSAFKVFRRRSDDALQLGSGAFPAIESAVKQ